MTLPKNGPRNDRMRNSLTLNPSIAIPPCQHTPGGEGKNSRIYFQHTGVGPSFRTIAHCKAGVGMEIAGQKPKPTALKILTGILAGTHCRGMNRRRRRLTERDEPSIMT